MHSWFRETFSSTVSSEYLSDTLFNDVCLQIDFPNSIDIQQILDCLYDVCNKRGECLDYDGSPYLALPDYTNQPVEWHFDGISSKNSCRIPDWIFFIHSSFDNTLNNSVPAHGFSIANSHIAYNLLSDSTRDAIKHASEIIFNHRIGSSDTSSLDLADLSIPLVQYHDDYPLLRAHIPYPGTYEVDDLNQRFFCYPDNLSIAFEPLEWSLQKHVMQELVSTLQSPSCIYRHQFATHSLLAVSNKVCFHSGLNIPAGSRRNVYRLQLINS